MTAHSAITRDTNQFLLPAIQYLGEGFFAERLLKWLARSDNPHPGLREVRLNSMYSELSYLVHTGKAQTSLRKD